MEADKALADELLHTPDMTTREQNYFYRMAFMGAKLDRRTAELKKSVMENLGKEKVIKALTEKLEKQGDITKRRGAFIWETLQKLERHSGAATLERVDGIKLLMEKAPP